MANSKTGTRIALKTGTVIQYCAFVADSPLFRITILPSSTSGQEKRHMGQRTERAGKVSCRAIIVISIGIWIALIPLWTVCPSSESSGCARITRTRYMCVDICFILIVQLTEATIRNRSGAFRNRMLHSSKSLNPANETTVISRLYKATTSRRRNKKFWSMR